ncbi:hypothetical protein PULV_b0131 [Pseudoalteromonas ulvae UL12]|uniref:hypothetical protein n=1 Tax=Pseudoalteromonas ulvae TaxID=107327 RepID=UPI00186B88B1|nr:hypothetical protein [Pseudoalteromonas ulvae]MBE0365540.1 hypothetical protein [Pseudoalteromonas ulvae UL12]
MKFKALVLGIISIGMSACVSIPQSTIPDKELISNNELKINNKILDKKIVPTHSYPVADTGFQLVQTKGGSVFLGPILGSMNISKNSKEMASKSESDFFNIVPYDLSKIALLDNGYKERSSARLEVTPFSFLQKCDDNSYRLSLVYHVEDKKSKWFGRYTYHIEKPIKIKEFPSALNSKYYQQEFTLGADKLAKIMKRDFSGELPMDGKKYNVGSLNLVGEKMGGMGIYTQPEELFFANVPVIEETDSSVILRIQGHLQADPAFGGLAFGVHYFKKSLLHKFELTDKS